MSERLHVQGVRHHSPACARLVADRIERLRPSAVLIEGPADFNGRFGELALDHELPVAIYSYASTDASVRRSWTPMCDYSPEWVALTEGRKAGAEVRFIDLPAWHQAFEGIENRYSDAERRYTDATDRLCRAFAVDNADALWDHLVEVADPEGLEARLDQYFAVVRGESEAEDRDRAREAYMAQWIRATLAGTGGPVLVVCGGFHAPALRRAVEDGMVVEGIAADGPAGADDAAPPAVPAPPEGTDVGGYLVPYSFKRLDSFAGYQSGMPSPEYYQRLWEAGPVAAAATLVQRITERLRDRGLHVSTSDLIGARSLTEGLARLRGHERPGRTDLLDGLASALISDDLERPLPWTRRGSLTAGTHPVVVEMTAALTGERVGTLHPDTPRPPLVADAQAELERLGLDREGPRHLDLAKALDLQRSRVLHCLRLLSIPGVRRERGPTAGADATAEEHWTLDASNDRLPALIEAGALGPTLSDAAQTMLEHRLERSLQDGSGALDTLAALLFDAALCGRARLTGRLGDAVESAVDDCGDLGAVGAALATVLALWRHDHLFGTAGADLYAAVVTSCASRTLWLAEGLHAGPGPADLGRLGAMRALRDAVRHAPALTPPVATVTAAAHRVAVDGQAPPDLRGAALGLAWALGAPADAASAAEGAAGPDRLGDWLAGLFAVAREEILAEADDGVMAAVDDLVADLNEEEFLISLPALRQAFAMFPPRERGLIAERVVALRGGGDARGLTARLHVDPLTVASSMALEARVEAALRREGLIVGEEP
jgi:hypothetical protein